MSTTTPQIDRSVELEHAQRIYETLKNTPLEQEAAQHLQHLQNTNRMLKDTEQTLQNVTQQWLNGLNQLRDISNAMRDLNIRHHQNLNP